MNRRQKKMIKGAITTYVIMMFGMIVVLYLMGFTSPFDAYSQVQVGPSGEEKTITSPTGIGVNILDWLSRGIYGLFESVADNPIIAVVSSIITIGGLWAITRIGGQYVLAYIIPLVILTIFANIFLFPTASLQGEIVFPLDIIAFTFLNLFLILSYLEFILGGPK